jgi:outer membrane protein assembly factor BamB
MHTTGSVCALRAGLVAATLVTTATAPALAQWRQWGGPNRNFTIQTAGLSGDWAERAPRRLWQRELGAGYSAIAVDDGTLYTMYRRTPTATEEVTVALDAKTGHTIWEHRIPAPLTSQPDPRWGGLGPNSTPLIADHRLVTIGSRAVLHCFDKRSGQVLWKHDLAAEFGVRVPDSIGYSASPVIYNDTIIVPGGRSSPGGEPLQSTVAADGQALLAFDQVSGEVKWKSLDFESTCSSPIIINFDGHDQLLLSTPQGLIGANPENGELLWCHPERGGEVTPVFNGTDLVFYSTGGTRAIGRVVRLTRERGRTVPVELWSSRKIGFWMPTPVRIDDYLYGTTDKVALCVNMETGERAWAKRGFPTASCLRTHGKLILLDENGQLSLVTATPDGLVIHTQRRITERYSLTVPSLVGTTLYVRDRKNIMALDFGATAATPVTN